MSDETPGHAVTADALGRIRLIAFDVDGVFTDGRFYLSDDGVETKAFHTQDGYGVRRALDAGLEIAVISGRRSAAVERRMAELGVGQVHLGCSDKVAALQSVLHQTNTPADRCAFVGDDMPDLAVMRHAGVAIAVANACPEVREFCAWTTSAAGGHGAVREVCDRIVRLRAARAAS